MLELHEGARIRSADGKDLGEIDRLVIEPSGRRVSHVVVRKGIFFPDDRVIPVDVIAEADESSATLRPSVDPEGLPAFEESHYVTLDEATMRDRARTGRPALAWAYPLTPIAGFPSYPVYGEMGRVETERNIPADSTVIEAGTHVVTLDDEDIGIIREAITDERGMLSHLTVDPGWFKSETVIPAHWILEIDEDTVKIGVNSDSLQDV